MSTITGPLRWGFFGAGKITSDFVTVLRTLPRSRHIPYGIASRDANKAKTFAESHGIEKSFQSYRQLAEDPEIDVVYIGTVNSEHYEQAKLAVEHKKHVLVEKAICVNYKQCSDLIDTAQKNRVFLMEGFWTVFFPAARRLFSEIKNGAIGDITAITLEVGRGGAFGQLDRFQKKDLGGGVLLNHGIYGLMLTYLLVGYPDVISAVGHLSKPGPEGIDETVSVTLSYKDKACISNVVMSCRASLECVLRVAGTKGIASLPYPFWAPDKCVLPSETSTFDIPVLEGLEDKTYHYIRAPGFIYEIEEVRHCIEQGKQQSPLLPWDASLGTMKMADEIRRQIGLKLPQDEN